MILVLGVVCIAGTSLAFSGEFLVRAYERLFEAAPLAVTSAGSKQRGAAPAPLRASGAHASQAELSLPAASAAASASSEVGKLSAEMAAETVDSAREAVMPNAAATAIAARSAETRGSRAKLLASKAASDDTHLVFDAMRALRQEGRPERASQLLDEYLSRFPRGPLTEEAMALSIEAKTRTGDPRAKDLAARYLARFPSGQFRVAAERAVKRFSP
jgi:hypothetical protein